VRNITVAAAAILLVVIGIGVYVVRNQPPTPTVLASPTATPTPTPTVTVAPTATQVPTPSPSPVGMYVNPTFKFSLVLPEPYRKSVRLSIASTGGERPAAADAFTARTEADEAIPSRQVGETAAAIWNYVAVVDVFTGTGAQTPRDFYNAFSFSRDQTIEDLTVDGHQAVKVTNAPSYPIEYLIKDGDRMFVLGYTIYQPGTYDVPPGATKEKLDAILASFKFVP
jgi:hypothetical protein